MRVLIIDDEKLARDELRFLLGELAGGGTGGTIDIVGEGENGYDAVELCRSLFPDAVFLDIQMPGMNGIEAASELLKLPAPPAVIFQTAYDEFAIKAFEVNAADYILKPVSADRLKAALDKLAERRMTTAGLKTVIEALALGDGAPKPGARATHLPVYCGDAIIPLKFEDIIFIEARGKAVRIMSRRGDFNYSGAFWEVGEKLEHPDFFQCHRSYIINLNYVERVDLWVNNTYMLSLAGSDERIPVSRGRMTDFKRRFNIG